MYNEIVKWVFELFKSFGSFMKWLVTPLTFNLARGAESVANNDLNTNGIVLESTGNNLAKWILGGLNNIGVTTEFTIIPLYFISTSIIIGLIVAGIVKVWFK